MPKLTSSVPKYSRHKASGQAVVTLGGRDFYLGKYGTKASKVEYDRLIGEWLAAGRRSSATSDATEITMAELLVAYLKWSRVEWHLIDVRPSRTAV